MLGGKLEFAPARTEGWVGMHSFAWGRMDNRFIFIGGRCDGLHARQPFRSFPGENQLPGVTVWNMETGKVTWTPWEGLADSIAAQLQGSNAAFQQVGAHLLFAGGYSYAAHMEDHLTHPRLLVLDLGAMLDALDAGLPLPGPVAMDSDARWAVTGGRMGWVGSGAHRSWVLVGGHRFDGRYNPIGRPTYTQTYTEEVQPFLWDLENGVRWLPAWRDGVHLHRRDFNWLQQVLPGGNWGGWISAGVFQHDVDLPFSHPVDIGPEGYRALTNQKQQLNQYHTACVSLFSAKDSVQHALFFGGMSLLTQVEGEWRLDTDVPFNGHLGWMQRKVGGEAGAWREYLRSERTPFLGGAAAEFLLHPDVPTHAPGIVEWDAVRDGEADAVLLGYVVGGIQSAWGNPFAYNMTEDTEASGGIWEVWWQRDGGVNEAEHIKSSAPPGTWRWEWEDERRTKLYLYLTLEEPSTFRYHLTDAGGNRFQWGTWEPLEAGEHWLEIDVESGPPGDWNLTGVLGDDHFNTLCIPRQQSHD